ncbi:MULTISPECIES: OsmC family protein [Halorussus]|uniref:OsmC family protein n=1 Tax=Halorussus TaxID=1070314 RepID=UPI000E20D9DB|nr:MULTISPECIES: OsmC family protein [Halorussus]NHN60919.1 OsmC family protein [Halorussus sp. JP-T4]
MAQKSTEHGVDLEQYAKFIEHATANPEDAMLGLGATGFAEGRPMHTLAKLGGYSYGGEDVRRETRDYSLQLGGFKEVEADAGFVDPADRPEPVEVALAALTGCINATLDVVALENGIDLDHLETRVSADLDPRVFFGIRDVEHGDETYDDITIDVEVGGPDLTDEDAAILREGVARSPVFNLVSRAHEMTPEMRMNDESRTA